MLAIALLAHNLQRFVPKPKPKKFLKALRSNTFKNFFVVRLRASKYCIKHPLRGCFIPEISIDGFCHFLWLGIGLDRLYQLIPVVIQKLGE
jgi:hypothetical protein